MSAIDRLKEQIGWLKVVFALLVAIDVSLIGWTTQNFAKASNIVLFLAALMVVLVTLAIIIVNRSAYKKNR
jgi:hypothetical protein